MGELDKPQIELSDIGRLSLFVNLNKEELKIVNDVLLTVHIKKGDSVFLEGDAGEEMYIHFAGALSGYGTQPDGNKRWLFNINPGEFFGEMSIITNEPRSVTIKAVSDSVVIQFKKDDFYRIISQHPITGFKILRTIGIIENQWLARSAKSYRDLIRWGKDASRRAITDEMTGLYNRSFIEESVRERFNNQSMDLRVMSMLMMDLDMIHGINSRYGTKAGDTVIIAAAGILRTYLRSGDIPARLSGDEFAVLLPDTEKKDAVKVAERIRETFEKKRIEITAGPDSGENIFISATISIGISLAPVHAKTLEELMDTSDTALGKAKKLGGNRVEIYG
jgi:diguanylate cyclase (GGDEF)-like protein